MKCKCARLICHVQFITVISICLSVCPSVPSTVIKDNTEWCHIWSLGPIQHIISGMCVCTPSMGPIQHIISGTCVCTPSIGPIQHIISGTCVCTPSSGHQLSLASFLTFAGEALWTEWGCFKYLSIGLQYVKQVNVNEDLCEVHTCHLYLRCTLSNLLWHIVSLTSAHFLKITRVIDPFLISAARQSVISGCRNLWWSCYTSSLSKGTAQHRTEGHSSA